MPWPGQGSSRRVSVVDHIAKVFSHWDEEDRKDLAIDIGCMGQKKNEDYKKAKAYYEAKVRRQQPSVAGIFDKRQRAV